MSEEVVVASDYSLWSLRTDNTHLVSTILPTIWHWYFLTTRSSRWTSERGRPVKTEEEGMGGCCVALMIEAAACEGKAVMPLDQIYFGPDWIPSPEKHIRMTYFTSELATCVSRLAERRTWVFALGVFSPNVHRTCLHGKTRTRYLKC